MGLGFEVIGSGRNLFWTPVVGVLEYEIDARESGGDRADYRSGITCLYTGAEGARCGYLFERDRQTSDVFRAAAEFRVRAVNEAGAGAWSVWVTVEALVLDRVEGLGYELGEFGRNLFWTPLSGVLEYEVDARESGGDRPDYRDGIGCVDTWERCEYLFERDRQTSDVFRASSEFRVRAVNEAGAGPWSLWVTVEALVLGRVEGVGYRWPSSGLVLFWDRQPGVRIYQVSPRPGGWKRVWCDEPVCEFRVDEDPGVHQSLHSASEFRVRAANETEEGPWSEWVTVKASRKPPAVTSLRYSVGDGHSLTADIIGWQPVRGADSYEIRFQYQGDDIRLVDNDSSGSWAERGACKERCYYRFYRTAERNVNVQVRALNEYGSGPWSEWVESFRQPIKAPVITDLVAEYGFGADDVTVHWDRVIGAAGYRVEWRYLDFGDGIADRVNASSNTQRVKTVLTLMADSSNYWVVNLDSAEVGPLSSSYKVTKVVNSSEDKKYLLEFRVTALPDDRGNDMPSNWVKWNSQKLQTGLSAYKCDALQALSIGSVAWDVVGVILALYSGGLSAGALAALKSQLSFKGQFVSNAVNITSAIEGCFDEYHPIEVLKGLSPVIGGFLEVIGLTSMVKDVTCGNYYLGTHFKDKAFGYDDIDGLLQTCYAKR